MNDPQKALNVSRETEDLLNSFAALVEKWTKHINLVSARSREDIWTRHILDSAQIHALAPSNWSHWADLGSGGGFPGVVIAILSRTEAPQRRITLVESDNRKGAFLQAVAAELDLSITVEVSRAEALNPLNADVVSARALAPLDRLLGHCERHVAHNGIGIFPKGRRAEEEIAEARKLWHFDLATHPSVTDPEARILIIERLERARPL